MRTTYRMRAKDGRTVWVRDEATVLPEAGGDVLQGVLYDVTEIKSAEFAVKTFADALQQTVQERA